MSQLKILFATCFISLLPAWTTFGVTVGMQNHRFGPEKVVIKVGESVVWENDSADRHTVTFDPALAADPNNVELPAGAEPFHSGRLEPGQTFTQVFVVPGSYRYVCLPHERHGMIGEIEVLPAD